MMDPLICWATMSLEPPGGKPKLCQSRYTAPFAYEKRHGSLHLTFSTMPAAVARTSTLRDSPNLFPGLFHVGVDLCIARIWS